MLFPLLFCYKILFNKTQKLRKRGFCKLPQLGTQQWFLVPKSDLRICGHWSRRGLSIPASASGLAPNPSIWLLFSGSYPNCSTMRKFIYLILALLSLKSVDPVPLPWPVLSRANTYLTCLQHKSSYCLQKFSRFAAHNTHSTTWPLSAKTPLGWL